MSHVSAKTEYACIALFELAARHASGNPVRIRSIAEQHGVPARFLVQILLQLKGAGLVVSTRGAAGGYRLARAPARISLADIMAVMEGPTGRDSGSAGGNSTGGSAGRESPATRALNLAWQEANAAAQQVLSEISLADLAERSRQLSESMYYI